MPSRARGSELADAEAASDTAVAVAIFAAAVAVAAGAAIVVEAAVVAVDTCWVELLSNWTHEVEARQSADRVCNCSPLRRTFQLQLQS